MTSGKLEKIIKNKETSEKILSSYDALEEDEVDILSRMKNFETPENKIKEVQYLKENHFDYYIDPIMYTYTQVENMAEKQGMDFKDYLTEILISPAVPGSKEKTLEPVDFTRFSIECLINARFRKDISNIAYFVLAMHCVGSEQYKEKTNHSPRIEKELDEVPVRYGLNKILQLVTAHQKADTDLIDEINRELNMPPESYIPVLGALGLNKVQKDYISLDESDPVEKYDLALELEYLKLKPP